MSGFLHNEDNLILLYEDERGLLEDELQVKDDLQIDQSDDTLPELLINKKFRKIFLILIVT